MHSTLRLSLFHALVGSAFAAGPFVPRRLASDVRTATADINSNNEVETVFSFDSSVASTQGLKITYLEGGCSSIMSTPSSGSEAAGAYGQLLADAVSAEQAAISGLATSLTLRNSIVDLNPLTITTTTVISETQTRFEGNYCVRLELCEGGSCSSGEGRDFLDINITYSFILDGGATLGDADITLTSNTPTAAGPNGEALTATAYVCESDGDAIVGLQTVLQGQEVRICVKADIFPLSSLLSIEEFTLVASAPGTITLLQDYITNGATNVIGTLPPPLTIGPCGGHHSRKHDGSQFCFFQGTLPDGFFDAATQQRTIQGQGIVNLEISGAQSVMLRTSTVVFIAKQEQQEEVPVGDGNIDDSGGGGGCKSKCSGFFKHLCWFFRCGVFFWNWW